jgi:hypothetical protein
MLGPSVWLAGVALGTLYSARAVKRAPEGQRVLAKIALVASILSLGAVALASALGPWLS